MTERIMVYAGEPMRRVLEQAGAESNRSGRLNTICQRYLDLIGEELPKLAFTRNEWCAICDVGNGVLMSDPGWRWFHANMWDSPEMDDKWDVDHEDLSHRLRDLSLTAKAAVCEVIERFWSLRLQGATHDELLLAAGATWPAEATAP